MHPHLECRLARYGNPRSAVLARWLAQRQVDLQDVADGLERLATALLRRPGQIGLLGGGYAYYPTDRTLSRWVATDGSPVPADLLTIALEYAGTVDDNPLDWVCGGAPVEEVLIHRRVDQAEYEAGQQAGDWR